MTEVGKLVARLRADLKSWSANIDRAQRDVRRFADHTERHLSRAAKAVARFSLRAGRQLARFAARWAKRAALAMAAIGAAAVKVASDAQEARNLFVQSMQRMADAAKTWANRLAASLKLYDVEVKKTLGTFNVMLSSMGLGAERAFEMSKALTQLTYDIASFYNLRPEDAFRKLQAGITGEIEPLKRLGILINETTVKTWALNKGLIAEGQELTEVQKVIARYGLILEQTRTAQGDFARTSGDLANVLRTLWAQVKKLGESIGNVLLPHVTRVAVALRDWIMEHRRQMANVVQQIIDQIDLYIFYLQTDFQKGIQAALDSALDIFRTFGKSLMVIFEDIFARIGANIGVWIKRAYARHTVFEDLLTEVKREFAQQYGGKGWFGETVARIYQELGLAKEQRRQLQEQFRTEALKRLQEKLPDIEARYPYRESLTADVGKRLKNLWAEWAERQQQVVKSIDWQRLRWERTIQMAQEWGRQMPSMLPEKGGVGVDYEQAMAKIREMWTAAAQATKKATSEAGETAKAAYGDMYDHARRFKDKLQTVQENIAGNWRRAGYQMEHSFLDAFDRIIFEAEKFRDVLRNLLREVARALSRELVFRPMVESLGAAIKTSAFGQALGMSTAAERHRGGPAGAGATYRKVPSLTFAAAPRLHRGLAADEFPAVLQRGEEVIAKDQRAAAPNVVIHNNTGLPMRKQQPPRWDGRNWVVSVVADNIEHGGVLNTVIANSMRRG